MATTSRTPIVVAGASGRMGRTLVGLVRANPALELIGATEMAGHPDLGRDAGELVGGGRVGVALAGSLRDCARPGAVLIEYTSPSASLADLEVAAETGMAAVLGTTGFTAEQRGQVTALASKMPCVMASNTSVGVTALLAVVEDLARRLGDSFDIEVVEMHHRLKKDSPSGTALSLAEAAARGRGAALDAWGIYGREGMVGERPREQIGVLALRGGDVVGDHTVIYAGTGERIEITHRAQSREAFASGALRAAAWVASRSPGLYSMRDVLGMA